jgi:thaumarchaeosortase
MRKSTQASRRTLSTPIRLLTAKLQAQVKIFLGLSPKALDLPVENLKRTIRVLPRFLPILAFVAPFLILYSLYGYTFEQMYQGRTFYLFFLWLAMLEVILGWENLKTKTSRLRSWRTAVYVGLLLLPTLYVVAVNYTGLNQSLVQLAVKANIGAHWAQLIPLTAEFMVFATLFASTVLLQFGVGGLKNFTTAILFLGIMGIIFAIDNLYPNGRFTPFQFLVQPTATLSTNIFRSMGLQTSMTIYSSLDTGTMPVLSISDSLGRSASFGIAWPCAGIESLLIYTVTISLFLGYSATRRLTKIVLFAVGAVVTYSLNIVRIVWIFLISLNGGDYQPFHALYGPLMSVMWIVCYPLIIMGMQMLSTKIRT